MPRLLVREKALADIEELGAFIARDNPAAATEVVRAIRLSFEQLAHMPRLGRIVRKVKTSGQIRMWLSPAFPNYLIFYRELPDGVDIVRVLHGARDVHRILENE
ncbi:MAG TPA: type II toxin-antitoxin system RelE/ParE family toxin [Candidatus Udaeobacter sp.]|jgi:toxin ParE1/3/4